MERFSDILGTVQKDSGSTFHSCQPELIELMRQIDVMVEEKRNEWESQISTLNMKLEKKTDEQVRTNKNVESANRQNGILRQQLINERNNHDSAITKYDFEISKLKEEVSDMRKKHERLLKKTEKFQTKNENEKENLCLKLKCLEQENGSIKNQLSNYESKDYSHNKQIEEKKMDLDKSLTDRCNFLETQISKYELDVKRQKQLYSNMESKTAKQVASLKQELYTSQRKYGNLEQIVESLNPKIKKLELELETEKINNTDIVSKQTLLEKVNTNLQEMLLLKERKIKQLQLNCENLDSSLKLNTDMLEKRAEIQNKTMSADDVQYWEERVTRLEYSMKNITEQLDCKISEIQVCHSHIDSLRMENEHLRTINANNVIKTTSCEKRKNRLDNSLLGVTALENENNELQLKVKELQQELASSRGTLNDTNVLSNIPKSYFTDSSSSSEGSLNSFQMNSTVKNNEVSVVTEFLEREDEREAELAAKLKERICEFDKRCQLIIQESKS